MSELPSSAIGATRMLPTTQTQIDVFSDQIIESVRQGEANPIEVLVMFKAFEKAQERILNEIRENYITEANKYPEKSFEFNGTKIEKAELGTAYNYAVCNDTVLERLDADFNAAKQLLDNRKKFLQSLKEPLTVVDEVTGEVVKINPPVKKSTSGLKVFIK
jgi:hypothetical protein